MPIDFSFSILLKGLMNADQPSKFPELFLTLGAPGDNLVIPLSPIPGRHLSLSLNLVPKEDMNSVHTPPNHPSPNKAHSGPSSPNTRANNLLTSTTQEQETPVAISVAQNKDRLSQTETDLTTQVKKEITQGGQKLKRDKPVQDTGKRVGRKVLKKTLVM